MEPICIVQVNNSPCTVVRDGVEFPTKSRDVRAGDLLKLTEDEKVPCDLVLLGSTNSDGNCYVTTGKRGLTIYVLFNGLRITRV